VPQIVEPDARQLGAIEYDLKIPLDQISFVQGITACIHENEIGRRGVALGCGSLLGLAVPVFVSGPTPGASLVDDFERVSYRRSANHPP